MISLKSNQIRGFYLLQRLNRDGVPERTMLVEEGELAELVAEALVVLGREAVAKAISRAIERAKWNGPSLLG